MSHAIVVEPKIFTSIFKNNMSLNFLVNYNSSSFVNSPIFKTKFDWIQNDDSNVETIDGPFGSIRPSAFYITKQLHMYEGFPHTYELIIEHETSVNNSNKLFFVFFIKEGDVSNTELTSFLNKKQETILFSKFLKNYWNNRNNSYYKTSNKNHVFIFPSVIKLDTSTINKLVSINKSPIEMYEKIFLSNEISDSVSSYYSSNVKKQKVATITHNITIKYSKEGFQNIDEALEDGNLLCYPEELSEEDQYQVVGDINGDMNEINRIFPHMVLMCILSGIIIVATIWLSSNALSEEYYKYGIIIFMAILIILVISLIISRLSETSTMSKKKKGIMNLSIAYFAYIWAIMQITIYTVTRNKMNFGGSLTFEEVNESKWEGKSFFEDNGIHLLATFISAQANVEESKTN